MEREDYEKILRKLGSTNCPICNKETICSILSYHDNTIDDNNEKSFSITNDKYIEVECDNCGYVMKFNKETLFK